MVRYEPYDQPLGAYRNSDRCAAPGGAHRSESPPRGRLDAPCGAARPAPRPRDGKGLAHGPSRGWPSEFAPRWPSLVPGKARPSGPGPKKSSDRSPVHLSYRTGLKHGVAVAEAEEILL